MAQPAASSGGQSQGVAYGLLTVENELDTENSWVFAVSCVTRFEVVFTWLFDSIPKRQAIEALDWLAEHGVKRILTHGGPAKETIQEHFAWLKELVLWRQANSNPCQAVARLATQNRGENCCRAGWISYMEPKLYLGG